MMHCQSERFGRRIPPKLDVPVIVCLYPATMPILSSIGELPFCEPRTFELLIPDCDSNPLIYSLLQFSFGVLGRLTFVMTEFEVLKLMNLESLSRPTLLESPQLMILTESWLTLIVNQLELLIGIFGNL
jgi:hypothetical protein